MPPLVPASLQKEIGVVETVRPTGVWGDLYETTPELRFPWCLDVYDRMRRQDGQVRSLLRATMLPILGTQWRIVGKDVKPQVRQAVEAELGLQQDDQGRLRPREGGVSWDKLLRHIMLHLPMGFSPLCRWYTVGKPDFPGLPSEFAHLNLAPRMPRTIFGFEEDPKTGALLGAWQNTLTGNYGGIFPGIGPSGMQAGGLVVGGAGYNGQGPDRVLIDKDRLVLFSNEMEGTNWAGESILRATYKHWLIKDALIRIGALSSDRQGMGIPVVTHPKDEAGAARKAMDIAAKVRAGEDAGLALEEGWTLALLGVTGNVADALKWVNYHDQAASRSMLAMFLDLGHDNGARALGESFIDFFLLAERAVIRYIEEVITEEIIRPFCRVNFGEGEAYPVLVADDPQGEAEPTAAALATLAKEGLIENDELVRADIRRRWGLPARPVADDGEEGDTGSDVNLTNQPVGDTGRPALEFQRITMAVGNLVRAGYDKDAAMEMCGLKPIKAAEVPIGPAAVDPAAVDPAADPNADPAAPPIHAVPTPPAPAGGAVQVTAHTRTGPRRVAAAAGVDRRGHELHSGDAVICLLSSDVVEPGIVFAGTGDTVAVYLQPVGDEDMPLPQVVERRRVLLAAGARDGEHTVPETVKATIRRAIEQKPADKTVPAIVRRLLSGSVSHADVVYLAGWFTRRHAPLDSTGQERAMRHKGDGTLTSHGLNFELHGGAAGESWAKAAARSGAAMSSGELPASYVRETEKIRERRGTAEARRAHPFKAAEWTHPNGHPRCLLCGGEERTGGQCAGADHDGLTTTQPGAKSAATAMSAPASSPVADLAARLAVTAERLAALAAAS